MISRFLAPAALTLALALASTTLSAQQTTAGIDTAAPALLGRVEKGVYISPTKMYRVQVPVLAELGGSTTDANNGVVTFQDNVATHVSIGCFAMDATQRWNDETRGRKDYLMSFFADIVEADFAQRFPGAKIESAKFRSSLMDGAIFAYLLLPGGTAFADHTIAAEGDVPPIAKRGNLLFIKDEHVYLISIELAEKVLERTSWKKTTAEEDQILETRLLDILGKMSFTKVSPPPASTSAPSSSNPAPATPAK